MIKNERGISFVGIIIIIVFGIALITAIGNTYWHKEASSTVQDSGSSIFQSIKEPRSTYIPKCKNIDFVTLARNPNQYKGQNFTFTGEVIQTMDGYNNNVEIRMNITPELIFGETYYKDTIYVTYQYENSYESRILEGDIVTIYGECEGLHSYISITNTQITLPKIAAKYIDIKSHK